MCVCVASKVSSSPGTLELSIRCPVQAQYKLGDSIASPPPPSPPPPPCTPPPPETNVAATTSGGASR
eukprot:4653170-Pyramimonas_sp.AAC.1